MRVIAIKQGYDGVQFRDPDARDEDGRPVVFDMPDLEEGQKPASWYVEVDEKGEPLVSLPPKAPAKKGRDAIPGQGPARGSQTKAPDKSNAAAVAAGLASQPIA